MSDLSKPIRIQLSRVKGYGCGVTCSDGTIIPAASEEHVFELRGTPHLAPEDRA